MKPDLKALTIEREEAWIGDAVLALYAREWIMTHQGQLDGELFTRFTSNDFLNTLGNPTSVEAKIGRIYKKEGLSKAFSYIEGTLLPPFLLREKNRDRQLKGQKKP